MGATHSQRLARFAAGLRQDALPPEVTAAARRHLADIVGVGLVGSRQPMARNAVDGIGSLPGSAGGATVWGRTQTYAAPYAAMANGVAAHVLDFDDTHTDSITHGSAIVGPVVMALGQELGAGGAEAIAGFVAGWEVAARVGLASRGTFHKRGFHTTSVAGLFGAVAAAGVLLRLDETRLTHAFGLAGSQVSGVSEYLSNGSSSKSFHPGWAAYSGIIACHLAKAGMTGPLTVFEGRYGLFNTYGLPQECEPDEVSRELGGRWEILRISIKPYPCCHFAHAFIDCAKALRRQVDPAQIESVEGLVPEIELPLICEPYDAKLRPDSPYAAKFSLPFLVASALAGDEIGHDTFQPENIAREDLLALAARVSYRVAKPGETTFPTYFPGRLEARLKNGRTLTQTLDINLGNPDNPLSEDAVAAKFRANAHGVLPPAAIEPLLDRLGSLERASLSEIAGLSAGSHA